MSNGCTTKVTVASSFDSRFSPAPEPEPEFNGFDLCIKWETEGLESYEEAEALAIWLIESGLVNSAGRYGRFVNDVLGGE